MQIPVTDDLTLKVCFSDRWFLRLCSEEMERDGETGVIVYLNEICPLVAALVRAIEVLTGWAEMDNG